MSRSSRPYQASPRCWCGHSRRQHEVVYQPTGMLTRRGTNVYWNDYRGCRAKCECKAYRHKR